MSFVNKRIQVDIEKPLSAQRYIGHNRWHPAIPPVLGVSPGDCVVIECLDGLDGQLRRDSTHEDVDNLAAYRVHPLTGPIWIEGAEPGDLLQIEILHVESSDFGTAEIIAGDAGILRELFPRSYLTRWELRDGYATSVDLPGVRIRGQPFMGVMGVAPSKQLLARIISREREQLGDVSALYAPNPRDAIPSTEPVASEGLTTSTPEEFGGNIDVKALTAGSTVLLPVYVPGALFSTGDGHFAQGDGEVCGTAIETANTVTVRFNLRKGEAARRQMDSLQFEAVDSQALAEHAAPSTYYATTGLSYPDEGASSSESMVLATKRAIRAMIDYLVDTRGYEAEQAYILCSLAVDLRISQCANPNYTVHACLPLHVFVE
jgi:formamidase